MIIELLKEKKGFTHQEEYLAEYIVENLEEVVLMNGEQLAENANVSVSTISRLSKKVGARNFSDFKILLSRELQTEVYEKRAIDPNIPFQKKDAASKIVNNISALAIKSIQANNEQIDIPLLLKIASVMIKYHTIDFYGIGSSLAAANLFSSKLNRIGFNSSMKEEGSEQFYSAINSDHTHCAFFISYSGEIVDNLNIAKILRKNKTPIILLTASPESSMAKLANYVIVMKADENDNMQNKIDLFSSEFATLYLFDCLYSMIYSRNYEENEIKRLYRERVHYYVQNSLNEIDLN